jgi:glycosyltransferase involved in cell wall biosynthesis
VKINRIHINPLPSELVGGSRGIVCAGNVYALTKYQRMGASSRVRFTNLIPLLHKLGWNVTHFPLLSDGILSSFYKRGSHNYLLIGWYYARRLLRVLRSAPPDLWWVEKEVLDGLPLSIERMILDVVGQSVIDYDDAIFLKYKRSVLGELGRSSKFEYYARNAGHLTVGSDYLFSEFRRRGACSITKIPSSINTEKYSLHENRPGRPIIIGWIGTPVTVKFLESLKEVLPQVARRVPILFHVIGARWKCPGVEVRCYAWTEATEAQAIQEFDIGVMPLIDGEWEKGKCAYKLIQYMAAGVVPVGSRVGENSVIIEDGVNGFIASGVEEWVQKLLLAACDSQLRTAIGLKARRYAESTFDSRLAAGNVDIVFRKVHKVAR